MRINNQHILNFAALTVFSLVFPLWCLPEAVEATYIDTTEKGLIFIDKDRFKDIPIFAERADYFVWPDRDRITNMARQVVVDESYPEAKKEHPDWLTNEKVSDVDAKYMAFQWIKTIFKPEFLPDDLFDHLVLLDGAENEADIVCVRYQVGIGYETQIVQTNPELFIVVRWPGSLGIGDVAEKMDSDAVGSIVNDIVSRLFDKSEAIILVHALSEIKSIDGFYYLHPKFIPKSRSDSQWWGHVLWWTDGITVGFYIPKFCGGPVLPYRLTKDWF